jgi:uncharacterized membrane protein YedE/YeeE
MEPLFATWPWYVAGPLIGLVVPLLYVFSGRTFGISSSLKHICSAAFPRDIKYFQYDWKASGLWNLVFVAGILVGGFLAVTFLPNPDPVIGISEGAKEQLRNIGITDFTGLLPSQVFSWSGLLSLPGIVMIVLGGFLIGFGARYAGGCTSGHGISGLANVQGPSLIAVAGFFAGGLFVTYVILPLLLN